MVVPPVFTVSKVIAAVLPSRHRVWLVMSFTWPLGLTVTGTEIGVPGQEPMYGVMV